MGSNPGLVRHHFSHPVTLYNLLMFLSISKKIWHFNLWVFPYIDFISIFFLKDMCIFTLIHQKVTKGNSYEGQAIKRHGAYNKSGAFLLNFVHYTQSEWQKLEWVTFYNCIWRYNSWFIHCNCMYLLY